MTSGGGDDIVDDRMYDRENVAIAGLQHRQHNLKCKSWLFHIGKKINNNKKFPSGELEMRDRGGERERGEGGGERGGRGIEGEKKGEIGRASCRERV